MLQSPFTNKDNFYILLFTLAILLDIRCFLIIHKNGMFLPGMFSAPTNPPDDMPMLERLQQSAHWCARHPGCYGVQLYDGGEVDAHQMSQ